jgi:hypothetical protein
MVDIYPYTVSVSTAFEEKRSWLPVRTDTIIPMMRRTGIARTGQLQRKVAYRRARAIPSAA